MTGMLAILNWKVLYCLELLAIAVYYIVGIVREALNAEGIANHKADPVKEHTESAETGNRVKNGEAKTITVRDPEIDAGKDAQTSGSQHIAKDEIKSMAAHDTNQPSPPEDTEREKADCPKGNELNGGLLLQTLFGIVDELKRSVNETDGVRMTEWELLGGFAMTVRYRQKKKKEKFAVAVKKLLVQEYCDAAGLATDESEE